MPDHNTPRGGINARPSPTSIEPDAHGQAALLLAESTLHALVEARVLTTAQAVSVIETAAEVKVDVADSIGESEGRMRKSLALLAGMERTFRAGDHFDT